VAPDDLLFDHRDLLTEGALIGPVLDLACGDGHNGLFAAEKGCAVVLADVSESALKKAELAAQRSERDVTLWHVDLEKGQDNPLPLEVYGVILVFRYLHRPLMPCIKKAMARGGVLFYETFTIEQSRFGKPKNPDHLLNPGELLEWFKEWTVVHYFEGIKGHPQKAIAQIVCVKPPKEPGISFKKCCGVSFMYNPEAKSRGHLLKSHLSFLQEVAHGRKRDFLAGKPGSL
jgi:tellurite methyltransferase